METVDIYPELTPIDEAKYKLGRYAAFDVSAEPMYDRDGLGEGIASAIDAMVQSISKAESAPRIFEVLQRWEARLFERGYHFLVSGGPNGWQQAGSQIRGGNVLAWQNANELWSINVYGARRDKIVAALTREVPSTEFCEADDTSIDRTAKDAANKYKHIWAHDNKLQQMIERIGGYFYTDERVCLYTRSVADAQRFGVSQKAAGETLSEDGEPVDTDQPNIKELTDVWGVLEHRVPLLADDISEMPWLEGAHEIDIAVAKAKYPWIERKISAGTSGKGTDQYDRTARMNTRLAVKNSTVSGESNQRETTETPRWFRPAMYYDIKDAAVRAAMFQNFPDGIHVRHVGSDLAFVRNESMDKHCVVVHARPGTGQNRRAIGSNYLPAQKALNTWVSLMNRFFVACVPHKYAAAGKINVDAMNAQQNDPAIITPVVVETGEKIEHFFGVEPSPSPQAGMQEAITYFMDGLPEIMDGASPAMFGTATNTDTVGGISMQKDQALQVFGTPWGAMCEGVAKAQEQAVCCAGANRVSDISSMVPGQGRIRVEIAQLRGNALCYPKADSGFPESWAETEARVAKMVEEAANSPIYSSVLNYPKNALALKRFLPPGMEIPIASSVEKQQADIERLIAAAPIDNPQYLMANATLEQLKAGPEAQTAKGQQMLQQAEQAIAQIPKLLSSVQVAQDSSEDHATAASISLDWMTSSEGRKYQNGSPEQQAAFLNVKLNWQDHEAMKAKLAPQEPIAPKASITLAVDKLPPNEAAQALQKIGIQSDPQSFHDQSTLLPHEVIQETEGFDHAGAKVKQRVAVMKPQ